VGADRLRGSPDLTAVTPRAPSDGRPAGRDPPLKDPRRRDGGLISTTNTRHRDRGGAEVRGRRQPAGGPTWGTRPNRASRAAASRRWGSRRSATSRSSCGSSALARAAQGGEDRYPGVDIILIEPDPNDELMFQTGVVRASNSRVAIARQRVSSRLGLTPHLAEAIQASDICADTRIEILGGARSPKIVRQFEAGAVDAGVAHEILEQTTGALLPPVGRSNNGQSKTVAACRCRRTGRATFSTPRRRSRRPGGRAGQASQGELTLQALARAALSARHLAPWQLSDGRFTHAAEEEVVSIRTVKIGDTQLDAFGDESRLSRPAARASSCGVR